MPSVVAVTGMGGLGKTQLAVEFAYRYGRYFSGGVFWLNFADKENLEAEVTLVGSERGMGLYTDAQQLPHLKQIALVQEAWQEATPRLLIFDNCEEEALLLKWLPSRGGCRVLLTSRRAYWSERLPITHWPLSLLAPPESVVLLQQVAPALERDEATAIAEALGHLPLALHLAGSFLNRYRQITAANYLSQLAQMGMIQHPSLEGRGIDHSPTGHVLSVSRTFVMNLEQLDPADEMDYMARGLLARAACLAPAEPIPITLLMATLGAKADDFERALLIEAGLTRLIQLGFLNMSGQETVVVHPLIAAITVDFLTDDKVAQVDVEMAVIEEIVAYLSQDTYLVSMPVPATHLQFVTQAALPRQDARAARLASLMGCHLRDIGAYEQADAYLDKALTIRQQQFGLEDIEVATSFYDLGVSYMQQGRFDEAEELFAHSLTMREQVLGLEHPDTAMSLNRLGTVYWRTGRNEMAMFYLEQALTVQDMYASSHHLDRALTLNGLSILHSKRGNYDLAEIYGKRALHIRRQVLGDVHPYIAQSLNNLGKHYERVGDYEVAQQCMEEGLTIWQETLGPMHLNVSVVVHNLGALFLTRGQYQQAKAYLERALLVRQAVLGEARLQTARTMKNLGEVYWQMGDKVTARAFFERTLPVLAKIFPPDNEEVLFVQQRLQ